MNSTLRILIISTGLLLATNVARAQFIEPNGPAPEGKSATFLSTNALAQQKLGSLFIGDGGDVLCLNGTGVNDCISTWGDLAGGIGGPYVRIYRDSIGAPLLQSSYESFLQSGFAAIQGTGGLSQPTVVSDAFNPANPDPDLGLPSPLLGTYVGIFSNDSYDPSNYAARFSGRLAITNHAPPSASSPGELCLNGTNPYNAGNPKPRYGCINAWTQLGSGSLAPYIKLQLSNPPAEYQTGAGYIGTGAGVYRGAWQFDSVVVGGPSTGPIANQQCGDGLCSAEVGETSGSCSADCQ